MTHTDDTAYMHIYDQTGHHAPALIVGNVQALRRLHAALGYLLAREEAVTLEDVFTADGEAFEVTIACEDFETMAKRKLPYTDFL